MFEREPSILISCRAVRCLILINVLKTPCCTSSFWSLDVVDEFATRSASILSWKVRVLSWLLLRFLQEMSVRKKMMKARKTLILSSSYINIMLGDPNCWSFFHFFWGGRQGERTVWERAQREGELGALSVMLPQLGRKSPSRLVQGNICRNECWRSQTRHGTAVFFLWKIECLFKWSVDQTACIILGKIGRKNLGPSKAMVFCPGTSEVHVFQWQKKVKGGCYLGRHLSCKRVK